MRKSVSGFSRQSRSQYQGEAAMRWLHGLAALGVGLCAFATAASAQTDAAVERLYVFDCGQIIIPDMAVVSPDNAHAPGFMVDSCYLVKHGGDYLLFDTGIGDAVAAMPDGKKGNISYFYVTKTLASQLADINVAPSDIRYLVLSHTHGDHVGNVEMFPKSTLLIQQAEYDWPAADGSPRIKPEHPVKTLTGDYDVFGDGSVVLISTPGHTPGHQAMLVKLKKTGAVLLSGDAVHGRKDWDDRRVTAFDVDKDKTRASFDRIAAVLKQNNAQFWIGHEKSEAPLRKYAPAYYE
jgi:N-acyl homoserine lactone hydrolase